MITGLDANSSASNIANRLTARKIRGDPTDAGEGCGDRVLHGTVDPVVKRFRRPLDIFAEEEKVRLPPWGNEPCSKRADEGSINATMNRATVIGGPGGCLKGPCGHVPGRYWPQVLQIWGALRLSPQQSGSSSGQPEGSHPGLSQHTSIDSMQLARSISSQFKASRTADRPPMIPMTKSEMSRIHSNVRTPRRLRVFLPVRSVVFIRCVS